MSSEVETSLISSRSSTCPLDKCTRGAAYFLRHTRFGRHKFRGEPRKQSNQIVRDQNLSVAMLARSDPDRRDANRIGDLLGDIGQDNLEHDGKCSRVFHRTGVRQQCFDLRLRAALDSVAALLAYTLRQHADVRHKRYSRLRDRFDLRNMTHTTFELYRLSTGVDKFSGGLRSLRRSVVSANRHIRDEQRLFAPARRRVRVMQHFVHCYIRSILITQNYHAYGVAHEDDVDATLIEQTRGGIIVRRERSNFLAAPLHLAKIFHCSCSQDQLPISERKPRPKAVRGRAALTKLTRNEIRLSRNFARSALEVRTRPRVAF